MRLLRLLVVAIGLGAIGLGMGGGAVAALLPELDTSSPAATLRSFRDETQRIEALYQAYRADPTTAGLFALADALDRIGAQLFDLHEILPAERRKVGNAAFGYLADILVRLPEIPPEAIPGGPGRPAADLPAHWTIPGTEIRVIRLTEGPRAGEYVFSASTIAGLRRFHAQAAGMPALRPTAMGDWVDLQHRFTGPWLARLPFERLPGPLHARLLGTPVWKLLLTLAVVAAILAIVLRWHAFVRRRAATASRWRRRALMLSVPVLLLVLVFLGDVFVEWQVVLPIEIAEAQIIVTTAVLYLAVAWAAWHACWLVAEAIIASPAFPDETYDVHLVRIVARVGAPLAAAGIVIYGANDIGVPALGLLAGVSIGGIALALAAQSTVENLFGGIAIFADRPFRVGDLIRFGATSGTVEAIGPRSTRIRGEDGTLMTVPNGDLAKAQLVNVSARPSSVFQHRISLPVGISSTQLEGLLADLLRRLRSHPLVETGPSMPRVRVVGLGAGGRQIEIEILAHVLTRSTPEFHEAQEALIIGILRSVEAAGIALG
jgi:MscS family membrane protein